MVGFITDQTRTLLPTRTMGVELDDGVASYYAPLESISDRWWVKPEECAEGVGNNSSHDDAPAIRQAIAESRALNSAGTAFLKTDWSKQYNLLTVDPADSSCMIKVGDFGIYADFGSSQFVTRLGTSKTTMAITQTWTVDVSVTALATVSHIFESDQGAITPLVTTCTRVTVSGSASSFTAGKVVKISSDDLISGMSTYYMGEFAIVCEVDAGNSYLYLTGVLNEAFATNIKIGQMRENPVNIRGGRFNQDDSGYAANWFASHFWLTGCNRPRMDGTVIERAWGDGIIDNCNYFALFNQVDINDCSPKTGVGYGILRQSSKSSKVQGRFVGCRHGVTSNPRNRNTTSASQFHFTRGRNWDCIVHDSHGDGCRNAAFDSHGDDKGGIFDNCIATNSFYGTGSFGCGFQIAGENNTMRGCKTRGCMNGVQFLNRNTDSTPGVGVNLEMIDCDIEAEDSALVVINSNTGDTDNVQALVRGGRLAAKGSSGGDMVQVTRADLICIDTKIQPTGGGSGGSGGNLFRIPSRGSVTLERCTLDLTLATGTWTGSSKECILTTPTTSGRYFDLRGRAGVSSDRGDANVVLTPSDSANQRFNTPLTTGRYCALPMSSSTQTITRTSAATGASALTIYSVVFEGANMSVVNTGHDITVVHPAHGITTTLNVFAAFVVGGITVPVGLITSGSGGYTITITDANTYVLTTPGTATSTVTNGGTGQWVRTVTTMALGTWATFENPGGTNSPTWVATKTGTI